MVNFHKDLLPLLNIIIGIATCITIIKHCYKKSRYRLLYIPPFFFSLWIIFIYVMIYFFNANPEIVPYWMRFYNGAIIFYYIIMFNVLDKEA